ncbi:MAG TPA: DUF4062 domain-containing protein [Pyrinomonadaceae bacterium]
MDKRYQVFVSSTYVDLQEERQEVIQALLELDCIPAGMELFPAADDDQWTLIKKVIDDCDYYIVIIGGRYGSLSPSGVSYTQMEYEYAVSQGKPIIGFIHRDPGSIPASKTEQSEEGRAKLESFLELVKRKVCKYWTTPSELGSVVSRSLVQLIKKKPAIGWIRADLISDEAAQEILKLRKQLEDYELLLEASRFKSPEGTDELSQGDDEVIINYTCDKCAFLTEGETERIKICYEVWHTTWNAMFAAISPLMLDEASSDSLKIALDKLLEDEQYLSLMLDVEDKSIGFINFMIGEADFQTIIIQFRALGLITKSNREKVSTDKSTYWSLTPYGDYLMTKLRAYKRPQKPSETQESI